MWLYYALVSCILWGCGYTILAPASQLIPSSIIASCYGLVLILVNVYHISPHSLTNLSSQALMCLTGYLILFVSANNVYLRGQTLATHAGASGIYTSVCGLYPILTMLLSYVCLNQRNLNLTYIIPGLISIIGGTFLLVLGKK